MTPHWQPYREPLRATLLRTVAIAAALGLVLAFSFRRGLGDWPAATLLALWPALGGHFVEILFLNHLRPHLPPTRSIQTIARLATWFVAGILLALAMHATALIVFPHHPPRRPPWWLAGLAFIAIELIAHLALHLRRRDGFYNGRG